MGCGASKTAVVAPETAPMKPPDLEALVSSSTTSLTGKKQNIKVRQRKPQSTTDTLRSNSTTSMSSELQAVQSDAGSIESRHSSATSGKSKGSTNSGDSGIGEEFNAERPNQAQQEINTINNVPNDLSSRGGLGIECKPNGIRHVQFAESLIKELPDSPSILKRPVSRGGMAFDVVIEDSQETPHMPAFSSNTKRRKRLTYQELQEKQRVVEQRKKEREQMIIERLRAKEERDKQVRDALEKFAEMQTELAGIKQRKQDAPSDNRGAYLNSLRDKLKEKSTHDREVKIGTKTTPINKPPLPVSKIENTVN